jgi:uracil-DNA glycosylase
MGEVRLVVVSAYPGNEEVKSGQSLFPSSGKGANAGKILQESIQTISKELGIDIYRLTYRTNAMKCPTKGRSGDKLTQPREVCKGWLLEEISEVPAKVPILVAGSDAARSLLDLPLYDSRGIVHYYEGHPVVVTINPIEVERGTRFTYSPTGDTVPTPTILGSTPWLYMRDMKLLGNLIREYTGV